MRKALTAIIALALVLGMTQCKKKDVIAPISNEGLFITFSANSNQGNTKTEFNPTNLNNKFAWSSGVEYVNVGGSVSGYLGQISGDGKNEGDTDIHREFSGSITAPQPGETLYFFYLGKGDHAGATSIDFAGQTGNLSDVTNKHIAIGSMYYSGEESHFSATLEMAMSIACFNTEGFVDESNNPETVYLYGEDIFSSANINYTNGTISGNAKSYICTGKANEERYVALIPGTANNPVSINFVSESHGGSIYFNGGINAQVYYAHTSGEPGLEVAIDPSAPGFVPYSFSVSSTKKVRFAKGNLQYKPDNSEGYRWRFAQDVADYTGNYNKNDGWNDLFSWGAWTTENPLGNAVSSWPEKEFSQSLDGHDDWHTLTKDQWNYLFKTRENANKRYCSATVENKDGLIILPDNWCLDDVTPNTPFSANRYVLDNETWNVWENNGAVFLPAAGCYAALFGVFMGPLQFYIYWTSTYEMNYDGDDYAYGIAYYTDGSMNLALDHSEPDGGGTVNSKYSVRLVRDVK